MVNELKVVGKNVARIGAVEKVRGEAKFVGDMSLPGMLHAKILRSPYAHARIVNIDASKAEKLPGVRAVLTYKNVPRILFMEESAEESYVLDDKVRFLGDEVLAIAADTIETAERGLELINVHYEELPAVFTPEEALKPGAPLIPPPEVSKDNMLVGPARTRSRDWGNIEEGFKEAEHVIEKTFTAHCVQHMPLEPKAFLTNWERSKLTVWATTQRLFSARHCVAKVLQMPETAVRIISPYLGGGFGSKSESTRYILITALLSKISGKPVKLQFTKEEDMLARTRPANVISLKVGYKKDGAFTAIHCKHTVHGGYSWCHSTTGTVNIRALYKCKNCRFEGYTIYTNHPSIGQMRGVLDTFAAWGMTSLVDQIAESLNFKNPMDYAKKFHVRAGDECGTVIDADGVTCSSCGLDECIDRATKAIGWAEKWRGWKTPVKIQGNKRIGMGMAAFTHDTGMPWMVTGAILKVNMDGTANFITPVTELGNATITTQAQVVSEASGIPLKDIYVTFADTEVAPVDPDGQVDSSTAHVRSISSKMAGEDAKRQLLERASPQLSAPPEAIDIVDGLIFIKSDPSKSITVKHLMEQTEFGVVPVVGRGVSACPHFPQKAFSYGAHFAIVEVDTETGVIKILKYVAAHDVGRALNPLVCEAQIQGGVTMGISVTLNEELLFDAKGKTLNLNYTDYKLFTTVDAINVIPIIVESNDPISAYGAKGFGEAPLVGVPGCLSNAIYNAIGIRFSELPITPERVLKALKGKK